MTITESVLLLLIAAAVILFSRREAESMAAAIVQMPETALPLRRLLKLEESPRTDFPEPESVPGSQPEQSGTTEASEPEETAAEDAPDVQEPEQSPEPPPTPEDDEAEAAPKPATFSSADFDSPMPAQAAHSNPYMNLYSENPVPVQPRQAAQYTAASPRPMKQPRPPKPPKKPFSPIPLLLIAGVSFLFLGGAIFLSSTWNVLADSVRAVILLSMSFIFFGVNLLAERVMKLPKTGLAFYILGCIFLPLTIAGIGVFDLLGEWFSFTGDGKFLLGSLICLCIAVPAFIGQGNYKSTFLAWMSLSGISGVWTFFVLWIDYELGKTAELGAMYLTAILFVLSAAASVAVTEYILRKPADSPTPIRKSLISWLYTQNILFSLFLIGTAYQYSNPIASYTQDVFFGAFQMPLNAVSGCRIFISILSILMAVTFLYTRFIKGSFHAGVFGFMLNLIAALILLVTVFEESAGNAVIFVCSGVAIVMMQFRCSQKLPEPIANTFSKFGMVMSGISILVMIGVLFGNDTGNYWLYLFLPCIVAAIVFADKNKQPHDKDAAVLIVYSVLLYLNALVCCQVENDELLLRLFAVVAALMLLVWFFLKKKLFPLALSVCSCTAVICIGLPCSGLFINGIAVVALIAALVYAEKTHRATLGRIAGLALMPFLMLTSVMGFSMLFSDEEAVIALALVVQVLAYCLLFSVFWKADCAVPLEKYIANLSIWYSVVAVFSLIGCQKFGWFFLLAAAVFFFACVNFKRTANAISIPQFLVSFSLLVEGIRIFSDTILETAVTHNIRLLILVVLYIAVLMLYAVAGRLLQPEGFYIKENGHMQVDWALLTAGLTVFYISATIDWFPAILDGLFLSLYSLLYIGRTQNNRVPALMASLFLCITVFFHNIQDPFHLLAWLEEINMRSPQILLTLLPFHLFILSLLWILPKEKRNGVHLARFVMYCATMFSLLTASLSFGHAEDAIVLAVFSLLILMGSFAVKKLRWFALGFSVLSLITVRMTWHFWQSLHWGIYLFLVGAVLIGVAFYYEYAVRRNAEKQENAEITPNPESESVEISEPSTAPQLPKPHIFKEWTW